VSISCLYISWLGLTNIAAFEKSDVFESAIADSNKATYQPPGELWQTHEAGGETYEIWKGSLADLAVQQVVKRIQVLVPFFIEGGTFIELREPEWSLGRWTVFFLYHKKIQTDPKGSPYTFMGYSTTYRYFYFTPLPSPPSSTEKKERICHPANLDFQLPLPEVSLSDLRSRSRISQFVILPPFQKGGNGSRLYNSIFDFYLKDSNTVEITVEDPNESFDDMRDLNDLVRLRKIAEFAALRVNADIDIRVKGPVPRDIVSIVELDNIRLRLKIAPRQFARLVEMQLLSLIPINIRQSLVLGQPTGAAPDLKAKQHEYRLWQLYTKQRLYRRNKDALIQLERAERIDKLEAALGAVEADYDRLLSILEERANSKGSQNGKRASPDDEAVEDEEPATKRVKVA
jgi:histone acetyltransferase 1